MKTIIIQYLKGEDLDKLIEETLKLESSSRASLARRAILNYCNKVINQREAK